MVACLLALSVGAIDEPKGFFSFAKDFLSKQNPDLVNDDTSDVADELPVPELPQIDNPTLTSVDPEDVANGGLNIQFTTFGYNTSNNFVSYVTTGSHSTSDNMSYQYTSQTVIKTSNTGFTDVIYITDNDKTVGVTGESLFISITDVLSYFDSVRYVTESMTQNLNYYFNGEYNGLKLYGLDDSGNYIELPLSDEKVSVVTNKGYSLSLKTDELQVDIYGLKIEFSYDATISFGLNRYDFHPYPITVNGVYYNSSVRKVIGNSNGNISITTLSMSDSGFFGGVFEWLNKIWEAITGIVSGVINGIGDILKYLFIPSEEDMQESFNSFDSFLADHFGFIYTATSVTVNSFESMETATYSTDNTIYFPRFTTSFSGTEFSFGGYDVQVIPDGFEGLADTLKLVVNIICSIAFLNVAVKFMDKILKR